ncbi:Pyruvate-flavodoxin_oxidoreductase 2 [Hexamita inflata]|uniref:Pyruvate-flavodoxin_oxidoreductase 2 n=1 Tax=Hexamita inflata TaxID=28002 RepID=A0ABP1JSW7_9EUKA
MSLCLDGNTAAAMMAYKLIDMAAIYPITPSSTMAELIEQYAAQGQLNAFGNVVTVHQAQSEQGAAACVNGAAKCGALGSSFTSSAGLLLMIQNLYLLSASRQPAVLHVADRSVSMAGSALLNDHTDIYAVSNTNVSAICSRNVQETHDMALATHLSAIESSAAFIHFFEGFRVSHQFETFKPIDSEIVTSLINHEKLAEWRNNIVDPANPDGRGIGLGNEIYYPMFEANAEHFNRIPGHVEKVFEKIHQAVGRKYELFEYTGHPEAETVIVVMGSAALTAELMVQKLSEQGHKVGVVNVRLWRPFSMDHFISKIPKTAKNIAVMDRARDLASNGEHLYKEVLTSLDKNDLLSGRHVKNCTYGICGNDLTPGDVLAIFDSFKSKGKTVRVGLNAPNGLKPIPCDLQLLHPDTKELIIYAIGSDGTIGAIRNAMKILQDESPLSQSQANFEFDGKKSGGLTVSYLRFGPEKIKAQFNPEQADYIACHTQSYIGKYDFLLGARKGATFVLNADFKDVEKHIPASLKRQIAQKNIQFYIVNANEIAQGLGLGNKTSLILSMFLMAKGMNGLVEIAQAAESMKTLAKITYAKQPKAVIEANMKAVDMTLEKLEGCKYAYDAAKWAKADDSEDIKAVQYGPAVPELLQPGALFDKINKREFNKISTTDVEQFASGRFPAGYTKYEKPGIADHVAHWNQTDCIQCNICSSACPHGCIRPFVSDEIEGLDSKQGKFRIQVSPLDCRGCQVCAGACPKKCISMEPLEKEVIEQQPKWDTIIENVRNPTVDVRTCSLKDLQLAEPYLFNPGSCPGCPETVIARMLTTLFGDHMVIASAVGCCLVWGHNNYFRPYQVDKQGRGPAVATSAFEDNSLFGIGMHLANITHRDNLKNYVQANLEKSGELKDTLQKWLDNFENVQESISIQNEIKAKIDHIASPIQAHLKQHAMFFSKQINWIIGGDGWSYDIDFGGIDHIMASGLNVNILIFNNNCFANTGGQKCKATPQGAIAKHAYMGVELASKKLCQMMMTYRSGYVAQVAQGANRMQALRALREAADFNGPSMVVAYCPCISHVLSGGMKNQESQQKLAVESGLWPLFRYDPREQKLTVDSKKTRKVEEFTANEQRFAALVQKNPERFESLKQALQKDTDENWAVLEALAK